MIQRELPLAAMCLFVAGLLGLAATAAHANGRLPAATALAIHPTDERQLLLGLTYGLALSRDGGASWTWMCEQQIEGNGGTLDPAMVVTGDGSLVVLSLTNGGVLVSRDDGCSFERTTGLLHAQRGVDLTLDPSHPGRVLALMSTVIDLTDDGPLRFRNIVAQSLDHGRSWDLLAELPDDLQPQTIEVAASDANRIYVTGTASANKLQGIVERSDDGGLSWRRTTVQLPRGAGSMFISAIHPDDPDRLWVRVPGYGDIYGVLPARLWLSTDGGASFDQVSDTQGGMLGFAISPAGDRIVFGGPLDGLFVAPSDRSATPTKVSDMPVSCLRWRSNGLYACALESNSPFSLGLAAEPTQDFVPLWHRANTCTGACAPASRLEMICRQPWEMIAPLIGAEAAVCNASSSVPDGGIDAGSGTAEAGLGDGGIVADAASVKSQPTKAAPARTGSGCSVTSVPSVSTPWWLAPVLILARTLRRRSALGVAFAATLLAAGCGDHAEPGTANEPDSGTLSDATNRAFLRWVGGVEETDVRVAILLSAEKLRLFFCGGVDSYATATRWFDLEADGEHVEFEDDTWRIHGHLLLDSLVGEVERADDVTRMFKAKSFDPATVAGLYEGKADCGRLGLIVTQDVDGDVTAQGACTGAAGKRPEQVKPIEPITSEHGMIRVHTPGGRGGTTLLQPAGLEPL